MEGYPTSPERDYETIPEQFSSIILFTQATILTKHRRPDTISSSLVNNSCTAQDVHQCQGQVQRLQLQLLVFGDHLDGKQLWLRVTTVAQNGYVPHPLGRVEYLFIMTMTAQVHLQREAMYEL